MLLADAAVTLVGPIAVGLIVDVLTHERPRSTLTLAIVLLGAAALVSGVTNYAAGAMTARVTEPAVGRLREDVLDAALRADTTAIEHAGTGDLTERLTADIERLSEAASGTLATFLAALLAILVTLVGLLALGWPFLIAGLLAIPVQAHTLRWYLGRSGRIYQRAREADSRRAQRLLEALRAAPVIRALGEQRLRAGEVRRASRASVDLELQAARMASRFYGRLNLAEYIGMAAILVAGYITVSDGTATLGSVTTAALFFNRLFGPINTVLGLFDTIQEAASSLVRVVGVIDMAPRDVRATAGSDRPSRSAVEVNDVTVVYASGQRALDGVTLAIAPGERVALVGSSGSGKTTLARVIAGFVDVTDGNVRLTDPPGDEECPVVRAADGPGLEQVILLEQTTHVFAGTLADDLRLADPGAEDERLREACAAAGIELGTGAFSDGLDSIVNGPGHELAAADAQHVALARLVLADPQVAILDEASADAGSDVARQLESAIDRVTRSRTSLIIAHRLSQAAGADRIVMLDHGRILCEGTHQQLLDEGGIYARFWDAWQGETGVGGGAAPAPGRVLSGDGSPSGELMQ
jgi:ATP-binding cassette, subfamily C, bacterial